MSDKRKSWLWGFAQLAFVILVVGLSMGLVTALGNIQDKKQPLTNKISEHKALSLSVVMPDRVRFAPEVILSGSVQAQAETGISAQVGGRVTSVSPAFKPGAEVSKGELLFRIDQSDYKLNVESAEAQIASARSTLAQLEAEAQLVIQEWDELYPGDPIPDLAAKKPQIEAAKASLLGAQAASEKAKLALSRTEVRAPDDMRILSTQLSVGQVIAANQVVGSAFPMHALEVAAPISSTDLSSIAPAIGRAAEIRNSSDNAIAQTGKVVRQDASLNEKTRLATLYIEPENKTALTVGSFVQVTIKGDDVPDALAIPKTSYSRRGEVWVVSNGRLAPRSVIQIGETEMHYIVRQFHAAEGLVVSPPINAAEGQEVVIRGEASE